MSRMATIVLCFAVLLVGIGFLVTTMGARRPRGVRCNDDGIVTPLALKSAKQLIGVSLEGADRIYCYSTEPDRDGGYMAWLKAGMDRSQFEAIVRQLGLSSRTTLPVNAPLRVAAAWFEPENVNLSWWPDRGPANADVFVGELGESGAAFVSYTDGYLFYRAEVFRW